MTTLQKIFLRFRRRRDGLAARARSEVANPERDWKIILYASMALFGILALLAAASYWTETNRSRYRTTPVASERVFTPEKLETLLSKYEALSREHTQLATTSRMIADPSQPK